MWNKLSMSQKAELMGIYVKGGMSSLEDMKQHYNSFADGGTTDPGMTGMMKARMALANEFGNPSAQRMVSANPNTYTFTGQEGTNEPVGEQGTHYMGSYDNIARPSIQEINGKMQFMGFPYMKSSREDIRFDRPEDAEYFAEHYKEIAPMMNSFKLKEE